MEMTIETLQYIEKHNDLHCNIISRLERKENYVTWLIIGAIQVAVVLEEEKELLIHYFAFDKLLKTLHTCYSRDLKHLLESVSETDQTDLMQWSSYIEDVYKPKDGDDRSLDLDFGRSLGTGIERRGCCEKSEENTDALVKEVVPMIPFNIDDRMCCRQGREHLDSNHSQRDHDLDREDQHYKGHFERESFYCEEHLVVPDHEDREPWATDQSYDRVRPEEAAGKLFQGPDFDDDYWEVDDFGQGNLGYRGIPKPSNWKRERSWEDWEYRCDHCLEEDFRAHHEALLPQLPCPQPAPEVRVQSPVRPPVKPVVGPPPVELGVILQDYSACYEALLPPHHDLHRTSGSHHLCQLQ